jgi:hypothetical protein
MAVTRSAREEICDYMCQEICDSEARRTNVEGKQQSEAHVLERRVHSFLNPFLKNYDDSPSAPPCLAVLENSADQLVMMASPFVRERLLTR